MKGYLTFLLSLLSLVVFAQPDKLPKNWHLLDVQENGYHGVGVEKAYRELLAKKKPARKVIVAIIDTGIDDTHPDLKNVVWKNEKEVAGNNKDDDKNGYPDDVRGWNFVGNTEEGTSEVIREYIRLRKDFENEKDSSVLVKKEGYAYWKKVLEGKEKFYAEPKAYLPLLQASIDDYKSLLDYYQTKLGKDSVDYQTLRDFPVPADADSLLKINYQKRLIAFSAPEMAGMLLNDRLALMESVIPMVSQSLKVADLMIANNDVTYFSAKEKITAPEVDSGKLYGNNVTMPKDDHGTACAGIVGAQRGNGVGMDGVANNVTLMPVRIFINAHMDEIDKDVAHAIEYAVDNGAHIINMSFGKYFSPQKNQVDKAIQYAEKKGVLVVCAAGNEAVDLDSIPMYPTATFLDKTIASNVIKVGASSADSSLVADYSNYGKKTVDVFAPGSDIYTTAKEGKYMTESGTSFAAPVVSGIAALIWTYYPNLDYKQVKYCIEKAVSPIEKIVTKPGSENLVPFRELSRTGGIVDAYKALQLAQKVAETK